MVSEFMSMEQDALEKYTVQAYVNNKWIERLAFKVEERRAAILEAKRMGRGVENIPIRVLLDRFNPLSEIHTQTLIFRNEIEERPQPNKKRRVNSNFYGDQPVKRIPISLWGYLGVLLNVLLIGGAVGALASLSVELMMQGFNIRFQNEFRQGFLVAMFGLVFLIGAVSSYQYYMQKYIYVPWRKKKLNKPVQKMTRKEHRAQKQEEEDHAYIAETMKTAADEIARNPIAEAFNTEDQMDELDQYHFPIAEMSDEGEDPAPDVASYRLFLNSFLSDCLQGMSDHGQSLTGHNRFGLQLFMKGAIDKLVERNGLSLEIRNELQSNIFDVLGLGDAEKADFLTKFPLYLEYTVHQTLVNKGKTAAERADEGDNTATQDMFFDLNLWREAVEEDEKKPTFILSCEPITGVDQTGLDAFHVFAQNLITVFKASLLEHPRSGLMAQFSGLDQVITASIDLQKYCDEHNDLMRPQMGVCVRPLTMDEQTGITFASNMSLRAEPQTVSLSQNTFKLFDTTTIYSFSSLGEQVLNEEEHTYLLYRLEWQHVENVIADKEQISDNKEFESLAFQEG